MNKPIAYPSVGMSYIINDLSELVKYKLNNQKYIILNTSAQPNSSPHLGTITTIMTVFALAQYLESKLKRSVIVQFDELENSPGEKVKIGEFTYYKDLYHSLNEDGIDMATKNMEKFKQIFNILKQKTGIPYLIRTYQEFQREETVRKSLIRILKDNIFFTELLSPKDNILHMRIICPECNLGVKTPKVVHMNIMGDTIVLQESCPIHGKFEVILEKNNNTYIDMNTQLRDLTKGIQLIESDLKNNSLSIMIDGNDWSGTWAQRVQVEGMIRLGYSNFVIRLFTPTILDWSGAKLSKSLYMKEGFYSYIYPAFLDYDNFLQCFGLNGINVLWNEVQKWIESPTKFFRNYSIEYFYQLFGVNNVY